MTKRPLDESGQLGNSTGQATQGQQNNEVNQPGGGNLTGQHVGEPPERQGKSGDGGHGTSAQAPKSKQK